MNLKISADLSLPLDAQTQTFAVLAVRGAGKSYTGSVMAEEMAKHGLPFVVIDPTGAWWGLRSSADGKLPGIQIIVMGGEHGDVPLEEGSGEIIADFIIEERVSVILDLSLLRKAEQVRFLTAFAERLYQKNRQPLHVFMDEADAYAPQKPMHGTERLLGAIEDIVRRGRIRGLGMTMMTQRAAVLNKNVLTQIETLVILRTISPQDRKAIDAWVEVNASEDERAQVAESLPKLKNGEAWFWSPSWLGVLKCVHIRARDTFNSSATPKAGEKRIKPKQLADVDLNKIKTRIASTIERVKANDPIVLKRRIVELEKQIAKPIISVTPPKCSEPKRIEVPVIKDAQVKRLETASQRIEKANKSALDSLGAFMAALKAFQSQEKRPVGVIPAAISRHEPRLAPVKPILAESNQNGHSNVLVTSEGLNRPQQRMLDALAEMEAIGHSPMRRNMLALMSGQSPKSSGYKNNLSVLRSIGHIESATSDTAYLTESGRALASPQIKPATTDELQARVLGRLSGPQRRMLEILIRQYPSEGGRDWLAEQSGQSPLSSGYKNNLSVLRSLGLVNCPNSGTARASDTLFIA